MFISRIGSFASATFLKLRLLRMIQSCCARSVRNHSDRSVNSLPDANELLGPASDRRLRLIDCSNLSLGQLPVDLIIETSDQLQHLILDGNELTEHSLETIPQLYELQTLSLNGNKVRNIGVLLQFLSRKCPNLKFLSLIGNPGWPHPIQNGSVQLYNSYAKRALALLPSLEFLDTTKVTSPVQSTSGIRKRGSFVLAKATKHLCQVV